MLPPSRVMVSSPFRYCAACETAFWRSQFLNQLVCVTATPAPEQDDERQHGDRDVARQPVQRAHARGRARLERLTDAEVYSPLPLLRIPFNHETIDGVELHAEIERASALSACRNEARARPPIADRSSCTSHGSRHTLPPSTNSTPLSFPLMPNRASVDTSIIVRPPIGMPAGLKGLT